MRILCVLVVVCCLVDNAFSDSGFSRGKQFLVSFMFNYGNGDTNVTANYLFISSAENGTVHVEMAAMGTTPSWRHSHSLVTGGTITIKLPDHSEMPAHSALQKRGIHVYADVEISVYAMNDDVSMSSADAAAVLPVTALSNNYVIPSPQSNPVILVVGLLPDTQVTINLKSKCSVPYKGRNYQDGSVIRETVGNQDVIELMPKLYTQKNINCDLSGSTVTASHPVAVFTGSACVYKGKTQGCDHEMEQVLPSEVLGLRFILPDLMDTSNYKVKIVAAYDSTQVFINEHHKDFTVHSYQAELDKGDFRQYDIPDGTFMEIFANHGIHVTQYDGTVAPFSIPIPAIESYSWNYTVSTMNNPTSANFINYVNLVIDRNYADTVTIDGQTVDQSKWVRVMDLGYSVATVAITSGSHVIEAGDKFMVQVYGYDGIASYAYQGGYFFSNLPSAHLGPTDYPPVSTISPTTNGNTTTVPCADSPGVDCQVLDLTIGICSSGASGQQLCRKHCGLCKTCTSTGSCIVG